MWIVSLTWTVPYLYKWQTCHRNRFLVQRSAWCIATVCLLFAYCTLKYSISLLWDSRSHQNAGSAIVFCVSTLASFSNKAIPNDLGRRESRLFYSCRNNRSPDCIAHVAPTLEPWGGTAADRLHMSQYLREFRPVPAGLQVAASVSNVNLNCICTKCLRPT